MNLNTLFQTFPQIETRNLFLRRIHPTDKSDLFRILSDDKVTQYYDDDTFTDITQAERQIDSWENGYKNRAGIRWGITQKGKGNIIGTCGYYGFHSWNKRASFGYELASEYWRQGIMTEALCGMIGYGFDEIEMNRVQAFVMPGNIASIMMLEKLGFQNEGCLEEYERWGGKGFVDLYLFAMLRKAWHRSEM